MLCAQRGVGLGFSLSLSPSPLFSLSLSKKILKNKTKTWCLISTGQFYSNELHVLRIKTGITLLFLVAGLRQDIFLAGSDLTPRGWTHLEVSSLARGAGPQLRLLARALSWALRVLQASSASLKSSPRLPQPPYRAVPGSGQVSRRNR